MAAVTDYASPTALAGPRSPDTASPIYPERAIRPLPKNRLKSKLSPQQASSLVFPPEPPPLSPVLNFASQEIPNGGHNHARPTNGDASYLHNNARPRGDDDGHHHHHHHRCTCGDGVDSGDDEVEFDHPDYRYAPPPTANGAGGPGKVGDGVQRRLIDATRQSTKPPPPASTASSADGYESFENTSNKKKRKIPLSATSSMHQSQLSAEMASMGISSGSLDGAADDVHLAGGAVASHQPYANAQTTGGAGTGISGAGRGRFGRQSARGEHAIRRPLGSSSMNTVNGYGARLPPRHASADAGIENTGGIISQAIKSAAEQGPLTPQKGQEKGSLLQSAGGSSTSGGPASTKTQFTFTVESKSASKMVDQQTSAPSAMTSPTPVTRNVNGQAVHGGTKTAAAQASNRMPPHPNNTTATQPPPPNGPTKAHPNNTAPPNTRPPPRRRSKSQEFALAAKQRVLQQRYTNFHHRPTKESIWICEFCEYESIFGVPPRALLRQYEIKDKRERKRAEERRRLLEKARAKGRRGRGRGKKGKGGGSNTGAQGVGVGAGGDAYDPTMAPPPPGGGPGRGDVDGEDFYDDDYDNDDYSPLGPPGSGDGDIHDDGNDEIAYDDAYYRHQQQLLQQQAQAQHPQVANPAGVAGGGKRPG